MNTGKFAAYKQLTPPNSDLSGVINQQERLNNAENLRKEKKAEKDRKNQLGLTKDLASINSGKKTQYLNFEHSLSDAFNRKGGLVEKFANAQKRLQLDPSDTEAAGIISNIKGTVQQIAATKNAMLKYNTALSTGIADGTISKELNKGFISNMQNINEGGVRFDIDKYGSVRIFNTGKTDLDGDGMPDEITLETLTDKNNFGIYEADFDLNSFDTKMQGDFETYEKGVVNPDGDNPYETSTTAGLNPENRLVVKDRYKSALGQNASSLTNAGKSLLPRYNLTEKQVKENPELYENFINKITSDFEKSRRKKDIRDVDQSAISAARRLALKKKQDQKEKEKKPYDFKLEASTDTEGKLFYLKTNSGKQGVEFKGVNTKTITNEKGDPIKIESLLLTDDGKIFYKGLNQAAVSAKKETKNHTISRQKEIDAMKINIEGDDHYVLDKIARSLKFSDRKDMFEEMKKNKEFKISNLNSSKNSASRFNK
jgi:hypothetical protein